jgi:hypothetical protein
MPPGYDGIAVATRVHADECGGAHFDDLRYEAMRAGWDYERFEQAVFYAGRREWICWASWFLSAVPGAEVPELSEVKWTGEGLPPAWRRRPHLTADRWVMVVTGGETAPVFALGAKGGVIVDAPDVAGWAVGRDTGAVAAYYARRGAVFVPLAAKPAQVPTPARRVLVTGSRDWPDQELVWRELDRLLGEYGAVLVIHGDRGNADKAARAWAARRKGEGQAAGHLPFPVTSEDWAAHPKSAGHIRNGAMVKDGRPDECLAFVGPCAQRAHAGRPPHGSHGATGCAVIARRAGVPVAEFALEVAGAR